MTRAFVTGMIAAPAILAALAAAPAPAAAEPGARAVALCRVELLSRFEPDSIRNHRVASISGSSRRTRVTFVVNADRRYTFECAAGADGRILVVTLDPARTEGRQLAAGQR